MIRLVDEQYSRSGSSRPQRELLSETSWGQWQKGLERWVHTRPGLTLALAVAVGATLAWVLKRRT